MKKILCLLLCVLFISGCAQSDTQALPELIDIPTGANPPSTITVEEILLFVNTILDFEGGLEFDKQNVEFAHEENGEILYVFDLIHIEVGILSEAETDAFIQAYFRLHGRASDAHVYMASVAGAFLTALEPNEAENMVLEVITVEDPEIEGGVTLWDPDDFEIMGSAGEYWVIVNHGRLMNILPRDALD